MTGGKRAGAMGAVVAFGLVAVYAAGEGGCSTDGTVLPEAGAPDGSVDAAKDASEGGSACSHASMLERTSGHSSSIIANQAVSRLRPFTIMWRRKMPSNENPSLAAATRDRAFSASHFHSTRRLPSPSNASRSRR